MATAATENEKTQSQSDIFNCTICLERFTKPKYLPCLHTFCEACLNTYIMSTQNVQDEPVCFNCPVCRQEVKSPDPKAPIEKWAELMPLNHMVFSLMGSSGTGQIGGETKCCPCERHGENAIAIFWCLDCQESLCELCKKYQSRSKTSNTHRIIPITEIEKSNIKMYIPDVEEPCPIHKGEILKVYCEDHHEMCCVICLSINHRRCDSIKTLDQMADSMKMDKGNVQLVNGIGKMCTKVKYLVDKKQQNIDKLQTEHQDILKEASNLVDQVIENLHKCKEEFKTQFSQIHKQQGTKLLDAKDTIDTFQTTLFNYEQMLKTVLEHGSPKQIFITSEKIKKQMKIQSDALQEFLKYDQEVGYNVNMDDRLGSVLKMTSLAEVEVQSNPWDGKLALDLDAYLCPEIENSELQSQLMMADISDLGAVKLWDVNGDGLFTGGIFLDDGHLLCTNVHKKTLNLFDKDGNLQISHSLCYCPWDVTQHSDGRIFVTDQTTFGIRIYSLLHETFKELKFIQLQSFPYGINVISDSILVMVGIGKRIHKITLEGTTIWKFDISGDHMYIATSKYLGKESNFYYCDNKNVICKTVDGKEIQNCSLLQISSSRGIALDIVGNIYMCRWDSGNVSVVSKEFKSSQVFMANIDVINKPYAMGFDKSGTKFFISGYNNGALAVYQLYVKK